MRALRHRIEHCVIVDPDLIERMARMNICPIVHTGMIQMLGKNFAEFYGPERNRYLEAVRSMLDAGIHVAPHSDAPSGPVGIQVIDGAVNAIAQADLLIVGGTSLNVWPAAGLINYYRGSRLALINKSPVARDLDAGLVITDPIGEVLSQL